ncbi:MAG TPA: hypothetical protein VFD02_04200 [Syntrophomonadaceae bacterium]|nr:hypothetical protein [Syntrophomonadaceae bacterium]
MRKMEMINRYVYAVAHRLPQGQREDIAVELRGLIEDMLDERLGDSDRTAKDIETVLLDLGNPKDLADKYRGTKKCLIGPELFDSYILVLKIVLIVVAVSIGAGFLIQTILEPFSILDHFINMIISIFTALPMAFAWTTFGFTMGEHYGGFKEKHLQNKEWQPSDLPGIPDEKGKIKRSDSIAGIVFYAIGLVFLTFSSNYFGVWVFNNKFTGVVPFLNEETYGFYLLFIIFIFGFGILKEGFKLVIGKWTYKLALFTLVINAISLTAILVMIKQANFWNPKFMNGLVESGLFAIGSEGFNIVSQLWGKLTFWLLVFLAIALIWDIVNGFIKARKTSNLMG